jgi:hypothetical protein
MIVLLPIGINLVIEKRREMNQCIRWIPIAVNIILSLDYVTLKNSL